MAELGIGQAQMQQEPDEFTLWPETADAFRLFETMLSQWRTGAGGPTGLDYAALPVAAKLLRMSGRKMREAFAGMRVMEAEALDVFAEQAARSR